MMICLSVAFIMIFLMVNQVCCASSAIFTKMVNREEMHLAFIDRLFSSLEKAINRLINETEYPQVH